MRTRAPCPQRNPDSSPQPPSSSGAKAEFGTEWGADPGCIDFFHAVDQRGNVLSCSTARYYELAGYRSSARKMKTWYDNDDSGMAAWLAAVPPARTASVVAFEQHIQYVLRDGGLGTALEWHMRKAVRQLRFTRWCRTEQALSSICQAFTKDSGRDTVVGMGDWSNPAGFLHRARAPIKKLIARLKFYCTVMMVDEFRTSKLHHPCGGELDNAKCHHSDGVNSKVYQVLLCRNRCRGVGMHRDKNAALNMLGLLQCQLRGEDRPECFRRGQDLDTCIEAPPFGG